MFSVHSTANYFKFSWTHYWLYHCLFKHSFSVNIVIKLWVYHTGIETTCLLDTISYSLNLHCDWNWAILKSNWILQLLHSSFIGEILSDFWTLFWCIFRYNCKKPRTDLVNHFEHIDYFLCFTVSHSHRTKLLSKWNRILQHQQMVIHCSASLTTIYLGAITYSLFWFWVQFYLILIYCQQQIVCAKSAIARNEHFFLPVS